MGRVLQLLPTLDNSGPSQVAIALSRALTDLGWCVFAGSLRLADAHTTSYVARLGLKTIDFHMEGLSDFGVIARLASFIRQEEIDVLHVHGFRPDLYGGLAGRKSQVKLVVSTVHGNLPVDLALDYGYAASIAQIAIRKWAAHHLHDAVVAVSRDCQEALVRIGYPSNRLSVVHNGILLGPQKNTSANASYFQDPQKPASIGTVAVLNRRKDIATLLRAMPGILAIKPQLKLSIVGTGPLYDSLQKLADMLGIAQNVCFLGSIPHAEMESFFSGLDLFVLPSLTEGIPIAVLEAMACGLPVVATKVGGTPEVVIDGETGMLVSPQDPIALGRAISTLLLDRELAHRMGQISQQRAFTSLSAERMADQYARLYWKKLTLGVEAS